MKSARLEVKHGTAKIAMLTKRELKDLGRRRELMRGIRSANELMSGVIYISVRRLSIARGQKYAERDK